MSNKAFTSAMVLCVFVIGCKEESPGKATVEEIVKATLAQQKIDAPTKIDPDDAVGVGRVEELGSICDQVASDLSKGDIDGAFATLSKHCPLPEAEIAKAKEATIQQLKSANPRFGDPVGYERITSRIIGKSVMKFVYIVKCENHLLRWRFFFYKPKDKWILNYFHWDDRIQSLE